MSAWRVDCLFTSDRSEGQTTAPDRQGRDARRFSFSSPSETASQLPASRPIADRDDIRAVQPPGRVYGPPGASHEVATTR